MSKATVPTQKGKIDCDQVAWIQNAIDRYTDIVARKYPDISRQKDLGKLALLLEIMETLGFEFEDDAAAGNAIYSVPELQVLRRKDDHAA
jgi:hypothetical protein